MKLSAQVTLSITRTPFFAARTVVTHVQLFPYRMAFNHAEPKYEKKAIATFHSFSAESTWKATFPGVLFIFPGQTSFISPFTTTFNQTCPEYNFRSGKKVLVAYTMCESTPNFLRILYRAPVCCQQYPSPLLKARFGESQELQYEYAILADTKPWAYSTNGHPSRPDTLQAATASAISIIP